MAHYLIGDLQGCDAPLGRLLAKIGFSASRDTLYLLGDLVNRGPSSAAVLRRLTAYGDAARCLLGNHDLSLLAVAHGHRAPHRNDTMDDILQAPDREAMLDWLRHRFMALQAHGILMVHGGVLPQWDSAQGAGAGRGSGERAARAARRTRSWRTCGATSRTTGRTAWPARTACV
jgi:bis(5'-nucleosyl)-tetraphosphatase (symmetrical)